MNYEDESFSINGRPSGRNIRRHPEGWTEGYAVTPLGIVGVYAEGGNGHGFTRLDFAWQGRQYMRIYRKQRLTPRALVTAATRFAREIVEAA